MDPSQLAHRTAKSMPSLDDSKEVRIKQLQDEAVRLLDLAKFPRLRRRAMDECIRVVKEMNRIIDSEHLKNLHVRTLEQAHRDLASGKLR